MTKMAKTILKDMNLATELWVDAVVTIVHLINQSQMSTLEKKTPYEALTSRKPRADHLWVFGCICYALVDHQQRQKLDAKSLKLLFIGYSAYSKAYRCLDPEMKRVHVSREISFFEEKQWDWRKDAKSAAQIFTPFYEVERNLVDNSSFESQSSDPSNEWLESPQTQVIFHSIPAKKLLLNHLLHLHLWL